MNAVSHLNKLSKDFLLDVGQGLVPGYKILKLPGSHLANVETAQLGDLSRIPSVVVIPNPGGIQLEVVSSSASDTSAGTGIQTLDLHYLDTSYDEQEETITLAGVTPVNTVATDIQAVQWMHALTVGSGTVAAGNISLRDTSGVTTYEYISAGGNQSLSAHYTVPNGKTAYLQCWHVSGLKKRIDFYLRATCERADRSLTPDVFLFQDYEVCEGSNSGDLIGQNIMFPAQCQIKISCQADAVGGEAGGSFTLLVVDD